MKRHSGRKADQIRLVKITSDIIQHASGSVLFELGNTKVVCAVTMQNGVPPFLRGTGTGWLNAEYAMLPAATPSRNQREATAMKRSGRSIEISRLIGRALRTIVDLSIGERTITIDCDVLQADGGTRTASITAAYVALWFAQERWLASGEIHNPILTGSLAAISVGIINNQVVLDIDYQEDSAAHADFNVVMTKENEIVEMQGGAEKQAISWELFDQVRMLACKGIKDIFTVLDKHLEKGSIALAKKKTPFFSLQNRVVSE